MKTKTEIHDFYCQKCGEKVYSLPRKISHKYQKHHYKRLWCWRCQLDLNCVECKDDIEVQEFKEKWLAGEYKEDVEKTIKYANTQNLIWS